MGSPSASRPGADGSATDGPLSWRKSAVRALGGFASALPIVVGMLLLTSLLTTLVPQGSFESLFGSGEVWDVIAAAVLGSLAAGRALAGP